MKKYIFTLFLVVMATGIRLQAQEENDYLGLPGDNLNLFAVMRLFQQSQTLEAFERDLNDENSHINNLDLDADGRIDYLRVMDNVDGSYHSIIIQDALGPRDVQDVAVFTVHRDLNGHVEIQLTGDESLYGRDYIIEPNYADLNDDETPNPGYTGYRVINGENVVITRTTTWEVASWPLIRFMFLPAYIVWHSPWYYNYYPSYWHPWRPYYWHYYYGYHYNWDPYYYGHYRVYHQHRDLYWHNNYYSHMRTYSPVVATRIHSGTYRSTYSHPEARTDGYNMYFKAHPDQSARRTSTTISDPVARRASQAPYNNRQSTTAQPARRSTTTARPNEKSTGTQVNRTQQQTRTSQPQQRTGTVQPKQQTRTSQPQQQTRTSQPQQQTRTSKPVSTTPSAGRSAKPAASGAERRPAASRSTENVKKSSEANTSRSSGKPAEKKAPGASKPADNPGGRR